jgi:hypothetical protein
VIGILLAYETSRDIWHSVSINDHSSASKVFTLSAPKSKLLAHKEVYMVSQLMEVDDLTVRLTTDENRAHMLDLAIHLCCNKSSNILFVLCNEALQLIKLLVLPPLDTLSSSVYKRCILF